MRESETEMGRPRSTFPKSRGATTRGPGNWSPWNAPSQWRYRPRTGRQTPAKSPGGVVHGWSSSPHRRRGDPRRAAAAPGSRDVTRGQTNRGLFVLENGYTALANEGTCSDPVDDIVTCTPRGIFLFSGNRREQGSGAIHGTEVCYGTLTDVLQPGNRRGPEHSGVGLHHGPGRRDRHRARPELGDHRADHDHPRNHHV